MKILLGLMTAFLISACTHSGHKHHHSGDCAHCKQSEVTEKKEACKNGCSH